MTLSPHPVTLPHSSHLSLKSHGYAAYGQTRMRCFQFFAPWVWPGHPWLKLSGPPTPEAFPGTNCMQWWRGGAELCVQ